MPELRIRSIIVDDEERLAKLLATELENHFTEIEIIGLAHDVKTAIALIDKYHPDLVFLDIMMPNQTGFDLLYNYPKINFEFIFVTSHDEYALNAIKVSALAYLLKPVNRLDLRRAIDLAKERISLKEENKLYKLLMDNLKKENSMDQTIAVAHQGETHLIKINEILCCEGWEGYTKVKLVNNRNILSSYSIGKFRNILEPYSFHMSHKSYLVNTHQIEAIGADDYITMKDGSQVPVSIRKKQVIQDLIAELKVKRKP